MSGWGLGGWFGGNTAAKKDAPKKAILQLRSTLEMLNKREKHLQNQMDEEDQKARKFINTNKTGMHASPAVIRAASNSSYSCQERLAKEEAT